MMQCESMFINIYCDFWHNLRWVFVQNVGIRQLHTVLFDFRKFIDILWACTKNWKILFSLNLSLGCFCLCGCVVCIAVILCLCMYPCIDIVTVSCCVVLHCDRLCCVVAMG